MSGKRKKNMGCFSSIIYFFLLIIAFSFLITFAGGAFVVIGIVALAIFAIKGIIILCKKLLQLKNKKDNKEKMDSRVLTNQVKMDYLTENLPIESTKYYDYANSSYIDQKEEKSVEYEYNFRKENNFIYGEYDSYLFDAGKLIVETDKASIGMIQRAFRLGFNRSARIMDQLCKLGVVGEEIGTKPRRVLMNIYEFENLRNSFNGKLVDYPSTSFNYQENRIIERINMYNNKFDYMEGHDFEYFCAELLRKNNYDNVSVTQESGDQGIDVIAFKDGVKYGIQCKCYSSDIGNKAVQEAYSGARFYDCHVPVVLTNRYFTKSAIELAKKNGVLLWDRDKLNKMIEN